MTSIPTSISTTTAEATTTTATTTTTTEKSTGQKNNDHPPKHPDDETTIKRNPHPDFRKVQAARPDWDTTARFRYTKTKEPGWSWGSGATDGGASLSTPHISIDPYAPGRQTAQNYKLLISGLVPRPIGFVSTVSADGSSTNLAPFSYTQVCNHDPPIFTVGFSGGSGGLLGNDDDDDHDNHNHNNQRAKDSLRNLIQTRECTINIVSEHFLEAANATSVNAPHGVSEWALSGLNPAPCLDVRPSRVRESVFSVEGRLLDTREFSSRVHPGLTTGVLAIVEGVRFWVREDALDETQSLIDPDVLRPMARLGGIGYGRLTEAVEVLRPVWENDVVGKEGVDPDLIRPKVDGQ